jgi:hypothetical protein
MKTLDIFENKPNSKAFDAASDSLRQNAYRLAKPAEHLFSVVALRKNLKR